MRVLLIAVAVVAGSALAADTVDTVIAASLGAAHAPPPARPVLDGLHGDGVRMASLETYLEPIVRRNVFLHGEPVPGEEAAVPVAAAPEEECSLPLQILSAVLVPATPELSLVTWRDPSTKRIHALQVGETAAGSTLVEVRREWIEEKLREESLAVFETVDGTRVVCRSDETPPPAAVASVPRGKAAPGGEGIRKKGDNEWEIAQAEIDAVMNGGLATLATTVRIVPYFESGKASGFKLYSVKKNSLLSKIGLKSGDVLRKVNGYEISSPEKALQVYGMLKTERNLTLDLTRGGKPQTLSYSIR